MFLFGDIFIVNPGRWDVDFSIEYLEAQVYFILNARRKVTPYLTELKIQADANDITFSTHQFLFKEGCEVEQQCAGELGKQYCKMLLHYRNIKALMLANQE